MTIPIVKSILERKPSFDGPLNSIRSDFRGRIAESILSGRMQTNIIVETIRYLPRALSSTFVDAGIKPIVENRVKRRIEK